MDLRCTNCGEPWDMDHVLHEAPGDFQRSGGVVSLCPCCPPGETTFSKSFESKAIQALGDVLGDDVDGLAAEMEDLGLS